MNVDIHRYQVEARSEHSADSFFVVHALTPDGGLVQPLISTKWHLLTPQSYMFDLCFEVFCKYCM